MRTLLVIGPNTGLGAAVRVALDSTRYRVIEQEDISEETLQLTGGSSFDVCLFDADLTNVEPIRKVEQLRQWLPNCPIILYAAQSHWTWEEDAYLLGVRHILTKPVRGRLLHALLDRLWEAPAAEEAALMPMPIPRPRQEEQRPVDAAAAPVRMLELLRDASTILCHSLSAEPLLKEFLLVLREILSLNRAAIFLRAPLHAGEADLVLGNSQRLTSACALGLAQGILEHFELSLGAGIGAFAFRSGRVLRRDSAEAERDPRIAREFDALGVRVAIPILARGTLIGIAMLDERITGEPMSNDELALIFHLLEQLGLAIKNIWWHEQVTARHEMMFDILHHIRAGCIVVGPELNILHANETAKDFFLRPNRTSNTFDFSDLPQIIGGKVFTVLKTGQPVIDYKYHSATSLGQRFQISITPFHKKNSPAPTAALVVVEDCSSNDRLRQLEIETANLRLVQQMADRLAHEIGNAVVPISTHQQLLRDRISDPEFQISLGFAMEEGVKRVSRLVDQMRFLACDRMGKMENVPVKQIIEDAFREARAHHPSNTVILQYEGAGEPLNVNCDRQGLQHAFAEVVLNALQASDASCQVQVRARTETDSAGLRWAEVEVQDSGSGFTPEAAAKATEPFFTTRKVGLGLGLAVTSKIIQIHAGKMEIPPPKANSPGIVRISLPLDQADPADPAKVPAH